MNIPTANEAYKTSSAIAKEKQAKFDEILNETTEKDLELLYKKLNEAISKGKTSMNLVNAKLYYTPNSIKAFEDELLSKGYKIVAHNELDAVTIYWEDNQ